MSLPLGFDFAPLLEQIRKEAVEWIESQWKWHLGTKFCILRGGPAKGYAGSELTSGHSVDHENLARLPALRAFIDSAFPARPTLAWLGCMPEGSSISLHVDNTQHWDEHHRVHVPLVTNSEARLAVDGRFLHLSAGRAWLVNNSVPHGALNRGPVRLHLALDLPGSEELDAWIAGGRFEDGERDDAALAELRQDPLDKLALHDHWDSARVARLLLQ